MPGFGVIEILIVALVVALLFGAPLLTFFLGYTVGKSRSAAREVPADVAAAAPRASVEESPDE